jgi:hypothetical protein
LQLTQYTPIAKSITGKKYIETSPKKYQSRKGVKNIYQAAPSDVQSMGKTHLPLKAFKDIVHNRRK